MKSVGKPGTAMKRALLIVNVILLGIGNCGGPLVTRLYFIHGGKRIWYSSLLETIGYPVIILPITMGYLYRRRNQSSPTNFFFIKTPIFIASAVIGALNGFDNYLYTNGVAHLPVSTSALITATQLAFTAVFAYFMVKQKFTSYSINAVFLLTIGAGILALNTSSDRPAGESNREYTLGFLMTVASAVLYGFILPLVELTYKKAKQEISYALVLEMQMVMCLFSTVVSAVGMLIHNDFKVIGREAREFELGETSYYMTIVGSALTWQCFNLGAIGVIFCGSSLLSAIIIAVLLPITQILAVFFYKEEFQAEKGISLALSLWGFASYFYGEIKHIKNEKQRPQTEMIPVSTLNNPNL